MKQTKNITPTNMICICCPFGCSLTINKSDDGHVVTGNKCLRGKKYAAEEVEQLVKDYYNIENSAIELSKP